MSNKLKNIFSNKMFDLGGNLKFKDSKSYKKFLEALQIVQNEGRKVEVKGVSSLTTKAKYGEMEYPFLEQKELTQLIISPSTEDVPFVINTKYGEKTVLFKRYHTTNEIILETDNNEIVYFKIAFIKNTSNITFTYRTQPHLAKTVKDIVENYNTAIALLNTIFINKDSQYSSDDEYVLIFNMRESILRWLSFFKKMYLIEQELDLSIQTTQLNNIDNDKEELEELYLLIIEKKVIRLNAKLNETKSTGIPIELKTQNLESESEIVLLFLGESEYTIYGQKISIHTANLLSHAIVKEVKEEDGTIRVLYGDTDNRPMYISYTGFKTIDEAEQEMMTILEHKEKYIDALTFDEFMGKNEIIKDL